MRHPEGCKPISRHNASLYDGTHLFRCVLRFLNQECKQPLACGGFQVGFYGNIKPDPFINGDHFFFLVFRYLFEVNIKGFKQILFFIACGLLVRADFKDDFICVRRRNDGDQLRRYADRADRCSDFQGNILCLCNRFYDRRGDRDLCRLGCIRTRCSFGRTGDKGIILHVINDFLYCVLYFFVSFCALYDDLCSSLTILVNLCGRRNQVWLLRGFLCGERDRHILLDSRYRTGPLGLPVFVRLSVHFEVHRRFIGIREPALLCQERKFCICALFHRNGIRLHVCNVILCIHRNVDAHSRLWRLQRTQRQRDAPVNRFQRIGPQGLVRLILREKDRGRCHTFGMVHRWDISFFNADRDGIRFPIYCRYRQRETAAVRQRDLILAFLHIQRDAGLFKRYAFERQRDWPCNLFDSADPCIRLCALPECDLRSLYALRTLDGWLIARLCNNRELIGTAQRNGLRQREFAAVRQRKPCFRTVQLGGDLCPGILFRAECEENFLFHTINLIVPKGRPVTLGKAAVCPLCRQNNRPVPLRNVKRNLNGIAYYSREAL